MITGTLYDLYYSDNRTVNKQDHIISGDIHITNADIYNNQVSIAESICSESNLNFGSCVASTLTFQIANNYENLKGKTLTVTQVLDRNEANTMQLGKFKVFSDKPSGNRNYRNITAYDSMYDIINANVNDWYNNLAFPMTLKQFRDNFFSYMGIAQQNTSLINDGITIEKTIEATNLSGKTVVTAICEANMVFGHIINDVFCYISLGTTPTTINKNLIADSGSYEDWTTEKITKVTVKATKDDVGVSAGTDGNGYSVVGNFLLYGHENDSTIARRMLDKVKDITYVPFLCKIKGNPCVQVGDCITIPLRNKTITTYVLQRTLSGVQALYDSFTANGVREYSDDVNSLTESIIQNTGKINSLSRTVDETISELRNFETQTDSKITQTSEEILSEVSTSYATKDSVSNAVKNLQDQIDDNIETFTGSAVPTLSNSPAKDWTTSIIKDTHIGDLYIVNSSGGDYAGFYYRFEKDGNTYKWVLLKDSEITKALADSAQALSDIGNLSDDLDENYYKKSEVYTKVETNSEISQTSSKILSTVSGTYATKQSVTDVDDNLTTNYSTTQQMNSAISQSATGIMQTVSNTYATQTSVNNLATNVNDISERTEANESAIEQNATAIEARVKTTDFTGNEIISKINLNSTTAVIAANRISLQGKTIDLTGDNIVISSDNFSVDKTGKITATSGEIAGYTINLMGFSYGLTGPNDATNTGMWIGRYGLKIKSTSGQTKIQSNGYLMCNYIRVWYMDSDLVESSKITGTILHIHDVNQNNPTFSLTEMLNGKTSTTYILLNKSAASFKVPISFIDSSNTAAAKMDSNGFTGKLNGGATHFIDASSSKTRTIRYDGDDVTPTSWACMFDTNGNIVPCKADTSATANTVAVRQKNGYLFAVFFNASGMGKESLQSYTDPTLVFRSNDGYLRSATLASAKTYLGLSSYLPLSGGTVTGAVNFANNTWNKLGNDVQFGDVNQAGCMVIRGISGDTGICFSDKNAGSASYIWQKTDGSMWINKGGKDTAIFSDYQVVSYNTAGNGYVRMAASSFATVSSKFIKENVEDISEDKALSVLELRPVTFDFITGRKNQSGLIAEDTYKVLPEVVEIPPDYDINDDEGNKKKLEENPMTMVPTIDYSTIVPYLIKLAQIQEQRIVNLENTIEELKGGQM